MFPFAERLKDSSNILIAGCGGGFDVFCGIPLAEQLWARGKNVIFANYSFSNLWLSGGERVTPATWRIDRQSQEMPYFPERWLVEWLGRRGREVPVYAFAKSGVRPLIEAHGWLLGQHDIDQVILVDGGTDSIIFGDEPGVGSAVEDAVSILAVHEAAGENAVMAAIGFGIDHYHGVSHYAFLENVAQLTRDGGCLGAFSLLPGMPESEAFLDLVDYANARQPLHRSIVCNSIASAIRGEFGDFHATNRTSGSELFINPLMSQYWTFDVAAVARRMLFRDDLIATERFEDARRVIEIGREGVELRPRRAIPL